MRIVEREVQPSGCCGRSAANVALPAMSQPPLDRDVEERFRAEGEPGPPSDLARWIGIAAVVILIVAFVLLHLTGAVGPSAH